METPVLLHSSPLGASTLMTSAPKSAMSLAVTGPATKVANSTTLIPESGPRIEIPPSLNTRINYKQGWKKSQRGETNI
jgi:hypothetical protein